MTVETFEKRFGRWGASLLLLSTWKREKTYIDPEDETDKWVELTGEDIWTLNKKEFSSSWSGQGFLMKQRVPELGVFTVLEPLNLEGRGWQASFFVQDRDFFFTPNKVHKCKVDVDCRVSKVSKDEKKMYGWIKTILLADRVGIFSLF